MEEVVPRARDQLQEARWREVERGRGWVAHRLCALCGSLGKLCERAQVLCLHRSFARRRERETLPAAEGRNRAGVRQRCGVRNKDVCLTSVGPCVDHWGSQKRVPIPRSALRCCGQLVRSLPRPAPPFASHALRRQPTPSPFTLPCHRNKRRRTPMLSSPRPIPLALPVGRLDPSPRIVPPRRHHPQQRFHLSLPVQRIVAHAPSQRASAAGSASQALGAGTPGSVAKDDSALDDVHLSRLPPAHDVDGDELVHGKAWLEPVPSFDHLELDSSCVPGAPASDPPPSSLAQSSSHPSFAAFTVVDEPAPVTLNHPRSNSLQLDLGDLPKPDFLFTSQFERAYPSPVSPCTTLFSSSTSSYFDIDRRRHGRCASSASGVGDEMSLALPPSPALVPISLEPAREPCPSPPAPHVEPSVSHPLHRAKRLSMTPLATLSSLPTTDAEPPRLRKNSIVDLPPPASPPLTPATGSLGLVGLPSIEVLECGRRMSIDSDPLAVDAHKVSRTALSGRVEMPVLTPLALSQRQRCA